MCFIYSAEYKIAVNKMLCVLYSAEYKNAANKMLAFLRTLRVQVRTMKHPRHLQKAARHRPQHVAHAMENKMVALKVLHVRSSLLLAIRKMITRTVEMWSLCAI